MRINKYLASCGLGSRRKVETLISEGRVFINGKKASLSDIVCENDDVVFDEEKVLARKKKYFIINKPIGYTSTTEDTHAEKKVTDLIKDKDVFIVGRLDKDSEGLLILTNDGEFAQRLIHPRYSHEREYIVKVKLPLKDRTKLLEDAIKFFKCGIRLDETRTAPAEIKLLSQENSIAEFDIVLKQGLKRQIRRTFEKAGLRVVNLKRIRIANFMLGDLGSGKMREISQDQINQSHA